VTASELIEELRAFIKRSGDLPVTNDDGDEVISVTENTIWGDKDDDPDTEVCCLEFEE
jgi:hypothetical protein